MEISKKIFEEIVDYTEALLSYNYKINLIRKTKNRRIATYNKYETIGIFDEVGLFENNSIKLSELPLSKDNHITITDILYYEIDSFNGDLCFDTKDFFYIMKFESKS